MGCIYFGEPDGRAERCRARGDCFSIHSGPVCVPDTARFAVPVDIPSPSSTSLVPARGGSAETQRPWRRRGKSLAYLFSSYTRLLAGGALNAPYFLIPWPSHLCSAGPMSCLSCSSLLCAQIATRTPAPAQAGWRSARRHRSAEDAVWRANPRTWRAPDEWRQPSKGGTAAAVPATTRRWLSLGQPGSPQEP